MAGTGWTGKGTGAFLGGIVGALLIPKIGLLLGAVIGALWGHQYDQSRGAAGKRFSGFSRISSAERQQVFFESVFLAMGRLAKVDGRVSEEEIQVARSFMHRWGLGPEEVRLAIDLFSRGKQTDFPIDQQMHKLAMACKGQQELLYAFLEVIMEIPLSKGGIDPAERELLWRMASGIGFSRVQMAQLEAILRAQRSFGQGAGATPAESAQAKLQDAYKALGIEARATDKEVKTAYRRLMNQHHPDKLASKGLPESMLEVAKERTREIRSAYELLRDQRGIR